MTGEFSVSEVSLTSVDAAQQEPSVWIAARWYDPTLDDYDGLIARFELPREAQVCGYCS